MSRFQNIQNNKFKILLSIREERKAQQPRKFNRFQSMLGKLFTKSCCNPLNVSTHIHITQEDIDKDLNEGRG